MKKSSKIIQSICVLCLLTSGLQAKEQADEKATSVTQTIKKLNSECDFNIVEAGASDILVFISKQNNIKVDSSEVEGLLEEPHITVTMHAKTWIGIISNIADQIDANILIGEGLIKLVPAQKDGDLKKENDVVEPPDSRHGS